MGSGENAFAETFTCHRTAAHHRAHLLGFIMLNLIIAAVSTPPSGVLFMALTQEDFKSGFQLLLGPLIEPILNGQTADLPLNALPLGLGFLCLFAFERGDLFAKLFLRFELARQSRFNGFRWHRVCTPSQWVASFV